MLFVAEIGLNHDGNFDIAHELIRRAKDAGADIAKFQFGWRCKPDEINYIDKDRARQLRDWCDYWDIEMMASIINDEGLELARHVGLRRYKIASRTVVDRPDLVQKVLADGKETFVSLGMWKGEGWPFEVPSDRLHYIFCRSLYPTPPAELRAMPTAFGVDRWYGYSDHCLGTSGCVLAIARGAQFVEKHLTLNKASQVIRDHILSATPEEFSELVRVGRPLARLVRESNARR